MTSHALLPSRRSRVLSVHIRPATSGTREPLILTRSYTLLWCMSTMSEKLALPAVT